MIELATAESIRTRTSEVRARIAAAGGSDAVTLVAVTKAFPPEIVGRALDAGLADLGENYAQELDEKLAWVAARSAMGEASSNGGSGPQPRWHFIGGLQRNKVKLLAGRVHLWHSIDRESLIDEIAKRSPGDRILIQVNTTGEAQKAGCEPDEVGALIDRARGRDLVVLGLMTVGPTGGGDPRPSFERLRLLGERHEVEELSMGMSGDFEIAVAEGSTIVRIGSALFGDRPKR